MGDNLVLRLTLPGVATPAMRGDNLAITLASFFEPGIDSDSDELDDSGIWKQGAIDASDEVIDAIHAHYAPTIATLTAERDALRAQVEDRDATIATQNELIVGFGANLATALDTIAWAADTLVEVNPSNYDHDDVCELNRASVEVALGLQGTLAKPTGSPDDQG